MTMTIERLPIFATYGEIRAALESVDIDAQYGAPDTVAFDGREYTVDVNCDEGMSLMDEQGEGVWCGRLEWSCRRVNDHGYPPRPEGFNGKAEILDRDHGDVLWWQVPADVEVGSECYSALRQTIKDVLEYGYIYITVNGRHSVGGIESMDSNGYHEEVARDLIAEAHHDWLTELAAKPDVYRWMEGR